MSRVIVLGAGASIAAGYPPASSLLSRVGEYCGQDSSAQVRDWWQAWVDFRERQTTGSLATLLRAENPEIVLSALDLVHIAREDHLSAMFRAAVRADRGDGDRADALAATEHHETLYRDPVVGEARRARRGLLDSLSSYFQQMTLHEKNYPDRRQYLKTLFTDLNPGDSVITFNWDTTAERSLGDMGIWNPSLGYGIPKPLRARSGGREDQPSAWDSPIEVLKVHGSVGWEAPESSPGTICFNGPHFLRQMSVPLSNGTFSAGLDDPDRRSDVEETYEPMLTAPTFLKSVPGGRGMQAIWHKASRALTLAARVDVWGYSLPQSDSAARVLFNDLRFRVADGSVRVVVNDPSEETSDRWDEFVGAGISREGRLG